MDVGKPDRHPLLIGDVDTRDARHLRLSSKITKWGGPRSSQGRVLYGSKLAGQSVYGSLSHYRISILLARRLGGNLGEVGERGVQLCLFIGMVGEHPRAVIDIGLHIEMAVAAQVE